MTTPAKPKRRWFQFSLRTLLLLVAVVAAALGWQVRRAYRLRHVVSMIHALGGEVAWEYQLDAKGAYQLTAPPPAGGLFGPWRVGRVHLVFLEGTKATDAHLARLKALPELKEVYVNNTRVTPAGISELMQASPEVTVHR